MAIEPEHCPELTEFNDTSLIEIGPRAELHGAVDVQEFREFYEGDYIERGTGTREVFPFEDPRSFVTEINPHYVDGGYAYEVNCSDCARCVESRWRGRAVEAAGNRRDGEPLERMERWTGERNYEATPAEIRRALEFGGPGSSAIIGTQWEGPFDGGHHYNVVNNRGTLEVVDGQIGRVLSFDNECIHAMLDSYTGLNHHVVAWDARGRRIL
ncbi:hypothetical protein JFX23_08355 [Schaalia cardiffensis]|uniref:toxin glutamine deamidase domain-containing protein n=1 Tax=Schaalia cardiffensis TaxID=181487 RepID=UPI0018E72598|nr:toxin glutamine deamidase domain-containing protein [Schaalia cardiffensis]MBJ2329770.1 hypothetical protein [Schaalia cardiffensis]